MTYFLLAVVFIMLLARTPHWDDYTNGCLLTLVMICIGLGIWEIVT